MPREGTSDSQPALDLFWTDLRQSIGLLTRLPLGGATLPQTRSLKQAMRAFPAVGLLIGLMLGTAFGLCQWLGFSDLIASILVVGLSLMLTGAFHEDGLADTADGLWGGSSRDGKLAIMRDSRLGTYGALALMVVLALRVATITEIADFGGFANVIVALAAAGAWSRALMVQLLATTPSARSDGLAAGIGQPTTSTARQALALGFLSATLLVGWSLGIVAAMVALAASYGAFLLVRRLANHHIGGQTGDIAGAVQQTSEIIFLLAIAACLP